MEGDLTPLALPLWALVALYRGDLAGATELSRRALEQLPENQVFLRGLAALSLAGVYHANGDMDMAASRQVLQEAALAGHQTGNAMITVTAACYRAGLYRREGSLRQARSLYQQALDLATDSSGDRLPIASEALAGLGEIAREGNELGTATRFVLEGIELAERWSQAGALEGYLTLARLRQAQGDWSGVLEALQRMRQVATEFKATEVADRMVDMAEAWMQIARGDLEGPRRWAERYGLSGQVDPLALEKEGDITVRRLYKYEYPVAARLRMAEGHPSEALALLGSALPVAEKLDRIGEEIARRLVVSLPTIKFHTSNIYGKLAVKNRTEAVARARGLGLLPLA